MRAPWNQHCNCVSSCSSWIQFAWALMFLHLVVICEPYKTPRDVARRPSQPGFSWCNLRSVANNWNQQLWKQHWRTTSSPICEDSQHPPRTTKMRPQVPKSRQNEVPGRPEDSKISKKSKICDFKETCIFTMFSSHLTLIFRQYIHPRSLKKHPVHKITNIDQNIWKIGSQEVAQTWARTKRKAQCNRI